MRRFAVNIEKVPKERKNETTFAAHRKINNILPSAKSKINQEKQGVYEIPCQVCDRTNFRKTNYLNTVDSVEIKFLSSKHF